jgi:hypothetical protein
MDGGFGNNVCVETVAEVDRIYVVTVHQRLSANAPNERPENRSAYRRFAAQSDELSWDVYSTMKVER